MKFVKGLKLVTTIIFYELEKGEEIHNVTSPFLFHTSLPIS